MSKFCFSVVFFNFWIQIQKGKGIRIRIYSSEKKHALLVSIAKDMAGRSGHPTALDGAPTSSCCRVHPDVLSKREKCYYWSIKKSS